MPSFIVKINKFDDLYVYWSSVVDAPHFMGTRKQMAHYLTYEAHNHGPELALPARFDRADAMGCSSVEAIYGWDTGNFIVEQKGMIERQQIPALYLCMQEKRDYDHILTPFEKEEEEETADV